MTENNTKQVAFSCPSAFLAFGGGSGLAPVAPGTFGTAAALLPFLLLIQLPPLWYVLAVVAAFFYGITICEITSNKLGVHDHGGIVWDEFVGLWIALFLVPLNWYWIAAGFLLFRLFDILKPYPIHWLDKKVHGGLGIMLDDVVAGLYAWLILQLLIKIL